MTLAILADIGGTNTRVALADGASVRHDSIRRYPNAEYRARGQDIAHVLRDYLDQTGASVSGVCVAAAGPVQDGIATGASTRNWAACGPEVTLPDNCPDWARALMCDPQTSGGLLVAVAPDAAQGWLHRLHDAGYPLSAIVGRVEKGQGITVI